MQHHANREPFARDVVIMAKHTGADKENSKMERKRYEQELHKLQVELCHLQEWVRAKGLKVIIVFEGRDTAGKGGTKRSRKGAYDDQAPLKGRHFVGARY